MVNYLPYWHHRSIIYTLSHYYLPSPNVHVAPGLLASAMVDLIVVDPSRWEWWPSLPVCLPVALCVGRLLLYGQGSHLGNVQLPEP